MDGIRNLILAKDMVIKFDIPYPTINLYTNLGFLIVVKKKGNKRLYEEEETKQQLTKISQLSNAGYPLRLIRKELLEEKVR